MVRNALSPRQFVYHTWIARAGIKAAMVSE